MNAITEVLKDDVVFVVEWESRMPIIVVNVSNKKRIVMDVPKLSTLEVRKRICFMNEKSMVSRNGDDGRGMRMGLRGGILVVCS